MIGSVGTSSEAHACQNLEATMSPKAAATPNVSASDSVFGSSEIRGVAGARTFPQEEMRQDVAYQIVHDELFLDGNARQNLATFCQTWDDENVHKLMDMSINKNWIDKEEYPQSAAISIRCVNMLADLWHAPKIDGNAQVRPLLGRGDPRDSDGARAAIYGRRAHAC